MVLCGFVRYSFGMGSRLADSLFNAVQKDQGFAFISDGMDEMNDSTVIAIARGSLMHSRRVVRILEKWLAKYDDGTRRRFLGSGSGRAGKPNSRQTIKIT